MEAICRIKNLYIVVRVELSEHNQHLFLHEVPGEKSNCQRLTCRLMQDASVQKSTGGDARTFNNC